MIELDEYATESSLEAFASACTLIPQESLAWEYRADTLLEASRVSEGIEILEQGLNELPESSGIKYRLVAFLLRAGKHREACLLLEEALQEHYDDHEIMYDFFPTREGQKTLYKIIQHFQK